MGFVVGKTLLLFVLSEAKIKGYMRELDMCLSIGDLNGIHSFDIIFDNLRTAISRLNRAVSSGVVSNAIDVPMRCSCCSISIPIDTSLRSSSRIVTSLDGE
jgi:hypothetical protein